MNTESPVAAGREWIGSELVATYNRARLVVAVLAALASTVVGIINGWPRGPAVPIVSILVVAHAYRTMTAGTTHGSPLLVIDAIVIGVATLSMGIPTVALLSLAFLMVAAVVLENGRRVYVLWAFDFAVLTGALIGSKLVSLPRYTAGQQDVSELVGVVFFVVATVALTRALVRQLRRADRDRLLARDEVHARERRFRTMLAHSSDGIAITDECLGLIELGEQNEQLTGYPREARQDGTLLDLVLPEDRPVVVAAQQAVIEVPDAPYRFQARIRHFNGEIRVMDVVVSNRMENPDLRGFLFNFHDVTDEHLARQALIEANRRLEELIRSKDEFIASVSHELRTPLTAVVGMAELLAENHSDFDETELAEFRSLLVSQARHTAAIVEDLLVAARADIGQVTIRREPCPVARSVDAVLKHLAPSTVVDVDVDEDLVVTADSTRLQQIIRNLITNAERHGGREVVVTAAAANEAVSLLVADDGPGVPDAEGELIFEPYHRTRESTQPGSIGLGLSVSRTLARLMGGDLVYRRVDGLTVFELTLPAGPHGLDPASQEARSVTVA